ncbi:MAG: mechanosensitive ion channel domain-containing protein, partial [Pseudomonadota bacterium]|nr:mechanosensitive ion channel domain-containing protein [Pseudomonadota bacterium]
MKDFASKHPDLQELLNQLSNYFPEILKYEKTITMLLPFAIQLSLVLIIILIAQAFSKVTDNYLTNHKKYLLKYLANLNTFTYALGLLVVLSAFLKYITFESALVDASILILAIRALPNMVNHTKLRESTKKRFVFIGWVLLVLMLTKSITPIIDFLDTAQFTVGEKVISVWSIVKAVIIFVLLIWAVGKMTSLIEKNFLRNNRKLSPSARTLIVKITNISGLIIAFMMTLDIIGIDLAAFSFFGGALGIGIGFGLQKVVGNLISGMILIMDKSIKPGDVITVADTYGEVTALHARYVVVRKRNGTEVLIPNEHLMTNEVINWSYENKNVRITVEVGVSYDSDIEHVQAILHEVTKN